MRANRATGPVTTCSRPFLFQHAETFSDTGHETFNVRHLYQGLLWYDVHQGSSRGIKEDEESVLNCILRRNVCGFVQQQRQQSRRTLIDLAKHHDAGEFGLGISGNGGMEDVNS